MGKKKGKKNARRNGTGTGAAAPREFTAPTSGLEDVYFTWGTAKDAAKFEDTVSALASFVGTQGWTRSSEASKAMTALEAPVITAPNRPVREYWTDATWVAKTYEKTSGEGADLVQLAPVLDDWEHDLDVEDYKVWRKTFQEQEAAWKENKAKCYYLVLSHCPKELEQELRNSSKWGATEDDQDVVALLKMIRDITHNKKERRESVMTVVESDVELFTIVQETGQSLDDYYKVFRAQVDTIDAHGGNAGHHPVVFQLHVAAILKKQGKTHDDYNAMSPADKAAIQTEAMKSGKEAYLACLFLLMADDDRYGGVKDTLNDNYLLGKQEYPSAW